jgi:transcriptional regulator with XRE-family HTH domain
MVVELIKAIGQRIRFFRKLRHLSQAALGHLMHISRQMIQRYEAGRAAMPVTRIPALCAALGITADQLFAGLPRRTNPAPAA